MLKKIIVTLTMFFLPFSIYADNDVSAINLPQLNMGSNTSATISLEPLRVDTLYKVTCNINNSDNGEIKILLEPRLLDSSIYGEAHLNNKSLTSNAGILQVGGNQLDFKVVMKDADPTRYNQVKLSYVSGNNTLVENCVAKEVSTQKSDADTQKLNNTYITYFTLKNSSSHKIQVKVGSVFPNITI